MALTSLSTTIALLSLNLHAFHPMGEAPRFLEDRNGKIEKADPDLFFYSLDEIARGSEHRAQALAKDLSRVKPDWIFFQEVAAGDPTSPKNCDTFYNHPHQSARQIAELTERNGKKYQLLLACRGNRGWWTDAKTFEQKRVVRKGAHGFETVYDFGANPFPDGMIVEGYAAMIDPKWEVLDHRVDFVQANSASDRGLIQLLTLRLAGGSSEWFMVANVHLAHKLGNFEQSVAAREYLAARQAEARKRFGAANEGGLFVTGDFNALTYRPRSASEVPVLPRGEISSVPWEMRVTGQYDFTPPVDDPTWDTVAHELVDLNFNAKYKPSSTVNDRAGVKNRVRDIVERYSGLTARGAEPLSDALTAVGQGAGACLSMRDVPYVCRRKEMIDHLYFRTRWDFRGGSVIYPKDDFDTAAGISDHPGIYFEFTR